MARAGVVVVTGGLGGAMEAASHGAAEAGGTVVGILPTERHEDANPYVTVSLPTGMGEMRNALIARVADGLIAVGGGYGTLSEVALGLRLNKPVVSLDPGFRVTFEGSGIAGPAFADPEEAVRSLLSMIA